MVQPAVPNFFVDSMVIQGLFEKHKPAREMPPSDVVTTMSLSHAPPVIRAIFAEQAGSKLNLSFDEVSSVESMSMYPIMGSSNTRS